MNRDTLFKLVEEAIVDADHADSKPSEYYAEFDLILKLLNTEKDVWNLSQEEADRIADFELRIKEKMKLKAFW